MCFFLSSLLKQALIEEPVAYIAQEPVDDVWISTYYPESKYSLEEIIKRHKEYAQPDMFNTQKSRVYLDMNINMRTKKKVFVFITNLYIFPLIPIEISGSTFKTVRSMCLFTFIYDSTEKLHLHINFY